MFKYALKAFGTVILYIEIIFFCSKLVIVDAKLPPIWNLDCDLKKKTEPFESPTVGQMSSPYV